MKLDYVRTKQYYVQDVDLYPGSYVLFIVKIKTIRELKRSLTKF